jgi:hypothetical protein
MIDTIRFTGTVHQLLALEAQFGLKRVMAVVQSSMDDF